MSTINEWKVEPLPIHGWRIVDSFNKEIVSGIYKQQHAEQIAQEHNAVLFAIRSGQGWSLEDWRNWVRFHATAN